MGAQPHDSEARRAELEVWAERRRRSTPTRRAPRRTRVVERLVGAERLQRSLFSADKTLDRIADRFLGRGLETSNSLTLPEHDGDRIGYVASPWHVLPRALRVIGLSDRDTFVEYGCGKGRVVHQAARYPFRRVIGVELSSELAEIARAGLAARSGEYRCGNVEIVVADAAQFPVPDDLTIAYFFRPFGEETLGAVLERIVESIDRNPRRVRLIYVWPMDAVSTILATGRFRLVKEQSSSLIHRRKDKIAIFESC